MCVLYRDPALPLGELSLLESIPNADQMITVPPPGFRHADESLNVAASSAAALEQEELPDLGPVFEVVQAYRQQEERRKQIKVVLRGQPSVAFLEIGEQKGSDVAGTYISAISFPVKSHETAPSIPQVGRPPSTE